MGVAATGRLANQERKIGRDQTAKLIAQTKTTSPDLSVFTSRLLQRLNQAASLPVFRLEVRLWAEAIHTPELRTLIRDSQARVLDLLGAILKSAEPTFTDQVAAPSVSPVVSCQDFVRSPTAIANFTSQYAFEGDAPRGWAERQRGGHFAPTEEPVALARDIAVFFASLI